MQSEDNISQSFNLSYFEKRTDYIYTRQNEKNKALEYLIDKRYVFIESGLGYGLSDFLYSASLSIKMDDSPLLEIDLLDVVSKKQLESKFRVNAGADIAQVIFHYKFHPEEKIIFHFKNLTKDLDQDTLSYMRSLPGQIAGFNQQAFFVFSSHLFVRPLRDIHVKLDSLSLHEVSLVLKNRFEERIFSHEELYALFTLSEGIIKKLDHIIYYMDDASAQDVLEKKNLFQGISYFENISEKTIRQIEVLKTSTQDLFSYTLIKILSILKNGESLKNINKSKIGKQIDLDNIKTIVDIGIAKTIVIDGRITIVKMNPIIKDYILSSMSDKEKNIIAREFLNITIVETKDGVKINFTNKKVLEKGYSTEGDNGSYLLRQNIIECGEAVRNECTTDELKRHQHRSLHLSNLSLRYVYALKNLSMYNEVISSSLDILDAYGEAKPLNFYRYYLYIASSFRILGKYEEAEVYRKKCLAACPENDKSTLAECFIQELYLLEKTDEEGALKLAKKNKRQYRTSSVAYIVCDKIIALKKEKQEKIKILTSLVKKSRKLKFHTLANNILFDLNAEKKPPEKMISLDEVLKHETSIYNQCRATLIKYEVYVESGMFSSIKDDDINKIANVYNYLFNQRFDHLFKRCHTLLWKIAENRKRADIIYMIYYKGQIIWILNNDAEYEKEYNHKFKRLKH